MTFNHDVPLERSYWVDYPYLLAGALPSAADYHDREEKIRRLVSAGIRSFSNLMEEREIGYDGMPLRGYDDALERVAAEMAVTVNFRRFAIPDVHPTTPEHMIEILDWIDGEIAEGRPVYVHCRGGKGRTGMVVGSWLVRHGVLPPEEVVVHIRGLRAGMPPKDSRSPSPETPEQTALILNWKEGR